jgi:ribosomal protein S18 acetylase RimI-like enzyme
VTAKFTIRIIADSDVDAIISLWGRCDLTRPWNDPSTDIQRARSGQNSTILIGEYDGAIVASVMVGYDGHRGWMYYVAVEPGVQNNGLGLRMVRAAEEWLSAQSIEKVMLMVRPENQAALGFYRTIGYEEEPRIIFAKWLDSQRG